MIIKYADFNGAAGIFGAAAATEWSDLEQVLTRLPVHLKASDQKGREGSAIFDVVGTNEIVKRDLLARGWSAGLPIPREFSFLGTDVDFCKASVLTEVQFSNYPFLLNNTIRTELFFKAGVSFTGVRVGAAVIVTKAHMFPASNSTLYYEQGLQQLTALARHGVFDVPIRLVGLFESYGTVDCVWTAYDNPRHSRTVSSRTTRQCQIASGSTNRSRASITLI